MGDDDVVLEVAGMTVRRGTDDDVFLLRLEYFRLRRGRTVAVVGPSGSGKSTLLDALALLRRPAAGPECFRVRGAGSRQATDLAALLRQWKSSALTGWRQRIFGYVLQQGRLLPFVSVRRNILLGAGREQLPAAVARLDGLARFLGIDELLERYPAQLSVGQRQRVAIARAVCAAPPIVLADEPTAALDQYNSARVGDLLVELAHREGTALVVGTHDPGLAARMDARVELVAEGGGSRLAFAG